MKAAAKSDLFRLLPSVDELLRNPQIEALPHRVVTIRRKLVKISADPVVGRRCLLFV